MKQAFPGPGTELSAKRGSLVFVFPWIEGLPAAPMFVPLLPPKPPKRSPELVLSLKDWRFRIPQIVAAGVIHSHVCPAGG